MPLQRDVQSVFGVFWWSAAGDPEASTSHKVNVQTGCDGRKSSPFDTNCVARKISLFHLKFKYFYVG